MSPTLIAIGASIAAFWSQARSIIQKLISIVIRSEELPFSLGVNFLREIHGDCKKFGIGNSRYSRNEDYDKTGSLIDFFYSNKGSYIILYKNFFPAIISSKNDFGLNILYIAGTFPLVKVLTKVGQDYSGNAQKPFSRFYISRIFGSGSAASIAPPETSGGSGLGKLAGPDSSFFSYHNAREWTKPLGIDYNIFNFERVEPKKNFYWHEEGRKIKADVKYWLDSKDWYLERGIVWRRGCLLHGAPGSGKSKLVSEICSQLDIPLRIFDVSSMQNNEFIEYFTNSPMGSVVLIEDIDSIFDGRTNILQETRINSELLTFDCLINALSGAKQTNGVYVFITTNNIKKLDPALIRSGRIDSKFQIPNLNEEGRRFIASNILKGFEYLINDVVESNPDSTAADFENICIELAKEEYWKNKK